jgi:hypothetical protein
VLTLAGVVLLHIVAGDCCWRNSNYFTGCISFLREARLVYYCWQRVAGKIPIISLAAEVCCIREAILAVLWQSVFAEVLLLFLQTQQLQFY